MTYEDLIRIAVETGTDGIDMTVYWMPRTSDDYLLPLRRLAYRNRVEIYSIGTRVRLAKPAGALQDKELADLRKWVDVAERLGATHVRVFSGPKPEAPRWSKPSRWRRKRSNAAPSTRARAASSWAWRTTAALPTMRRRRSQIVKGADSPWAGMNLDIGNFRPPDVYGQIEVSIPYAVSTHVKTEMALDDGKTRGPFDWDRVFTMFARQGFKGYMGLEYRGRRGSARRGAAIPDDVESDGGEVFGVKGLPPKGGSYMRKPRRKLTELRTSSRRLRPQMMLAWRRSPSAPRQCVSRLIAPW